MAKIEIGFANARVPEVNDIATELLGWNEFRPVKMSRARDRNIINKLRQNARDNGQVGTEYTDWLQGADNVPADIAAEAPAAMLSKGELVVLVMAKDLAEKAQQAAQVKRARIADAAAAAGDTALGDDFE